MSVLKRQKTQPIIVSPIDYEISPIRFYSLSSERDLEKDRADSLNFSLISNDNEALALATREEESVSLTQTVWLLVKSALLLSYKA
jgi:hypothetical protein